MALTPSAMSIRTSLALCSLVTSLASSSAVAQLGVGQVPTTPPPAERAAGPRAMTVALGRSALPSVTPVRVDGSRPSKVPYLLVGGIAGMVAAAITLSATEPAEASTDLSFVIGVAAFPSAAIGAGIGWLVYELRH